ncbi:MAG TPA: hypothetical protein DEA62_03135 [Coxiellaceae bacterium]|nr:hypothetical protein [Coxiellaceae bacterium]
MIKLLKIFYSTCLMFCAISFFAQIYAAKNCYSNMSEVLGCFLSYNDGVYKYKFISEESREGSDITIKTYLLYSQKWPINKQEDIPTTIWKHKLVIYIPKQISYPKTLLYVNGGRTKNIKGDEEFLSSKEQIDYVKIALSNKAPVVELQDVPNQYLFFNNEPVKEDQILAYTYKKVMDDPLQNAYLAGHLPMAKAVLKAMDAAQEIFKQERNIDIKSFVLSGASKRGWSMWLAAIQDDRVEAIVPIVIDILNTQKSITHICGSYCGVCPPALRDYEKYEITKKINTSAFSSLMAIEDPYNYLKDNYDGGYKARMTMPKYLINASGDDFFVPDSSKWYFKNLPGENNYIRYLPNAMHYFKGNAISDSTGSLQAINAALDSYFYFILNKVSLPKVSWVLHSDKIEVISSLKPSMVKLWVANNEHARDFRFITSYSRFHLLMKKVFYYFSGSMGDNCYTEKSVPFDCGENTSCKIQVSLPAFKKGWQASFVELHYEINQIPFIITTEVNIAPDVMPKG